VARRPRSTIGHTYARIFRVVLARRYRFSRRSANNTVVHRSSVIVLAAKPSL